ISWNKLVIQPINPSDRITVQSVGPKQIRNKHGKSIAIIPSASKTNGQKGERKLTPIHITRQAGIAIGLAGSPCSRLKLSIYALAFCSDSRLKATVRYSGLLSFNPSASSS